jgi:hypothetical protein
MLAARLRRAGGPIALGLVFIAVVLNTARILRVQESGSVGPDAIAPIVEFQRILALSRVEGYLTQTSKPLLDLVYGPVWAAFGDWRAVALVAIAGFGLCVALGTLLAVRVGGRASAAFAAVALGLSPVLLIDVSLAYAVTPMAVCLLMAGLAVSGQRPHYLVAGMFMGLAALARPEAFAVLGLASAALAASAVTGRLGRTPPPPRAAAAILVGWLAVGILLIHDGLVFGDPLFWTKTALAASSGRSTRGLIAMCLWMAHHFALNVVLVVPTLAALWVLIARGKWPLAVGLFGAVFGVAAFFIVAGARGTVVTERYLEPIDVAMAYASSIGISALDRPGLRARMAAVRSWRPWGRVAWLAPIAAGVVLAMALAPMEPLDHTAAVDIATQVRLHRNAQRAYAVIDGELGPRPAWHGRPPGDTISAQPLVVVPPRLRQQAVVQLNLPLDLVAYDYGDVLDPAKGVAPVGAIIYHDAIDDDASAKRLKAIEVSTPTVIGPYRFVPLFVDATAGIWVLRVEAATGAGGG